MMEQRKITVDRRHRRGPPRRGRRAPARPLAHRDGLGRRSVNPGDPSPSSRRSLALLLGLAIGKAWERYKLRDGNWIDRRRARDSHHYVLGLNFLVAEPDRSRDRGAEPGGARRRDALEIHLILGNVLSRARPGGARHPGAPGAAAAAEAHQGRARLRPAVPRPRLQARRLRRSRARGVQRSDPAGSVEPVRAALPAEAARGAASVGRRAPHPQAAGGAERARDASRATRRSSRSSRTSSAPRRCAPAIAATRRGTSSRRSIRIPTPRRRYLNLGDVRFIAGRSRGRRARVGRLDRRARPIAPTSPSIGSSALYAAAGTAAALRRALPRLVAAIRRTGAPGWRSAATWPRVDRHLHTKTRSSYNSNNNQKN